MPELRTGAIIVHPYDEIGIAKSLHQALEMPELERRQWMLRMRQQIRHTDILRWRDRVFQQLEHTGSEPKLAVKFHTCSDVSSSRTVSDYLKVSLRYALRPLSSRQVPAE